MAYIPNYMAKNLKLKTTKTIGIITEDLTVFNCAEIVDGIHELEMETPHAFAISRMVAMPYPPFRFRPYGRWILNGYYSTCSPYSKPVDCGFLLRHLPHLRIVPLLPKLLYRRYDGRCRKGLFGM